MRAAVPNSVLHSSSAGDGTIDQHLKYMPSLIERLVSYKLVCRPSDSGKLCCYWAAWHQFGMRSKR